MAEHNLARPAPRRPNVRKPLQLFLDIGMVGLTDRVADKRNLYHQGTPPVAVTPALCRAARDPPGPAWLSRDPDAGHSPAAAGQGLFILNTSLC